MQRDGELDHAEPGAEVPAGGGDGVDGLLAQLVGQLAQLPAVETAHVGRCFDEVEQRGLGSVVDMGHAVPDGLRRVLDNSARILQH